MPTPAHLLKPLTLACLAIGLHAVSLAQTSTPNPAADVLRNIEQNRPEFNRPEIRPIETKPPVSNAEKGFARLKEIVVDSPILQKELSDFWIPNINKPVPGEKISAFKSYFWDLFQRKGYLAYLNLSTQETAQGTILTIHVVKPVIGEISVALTDEARGKQYREQIIERFKQAYPIGSQVDIAGFEAHLNATSYDLPVDLSVNLRKSDEKTVDVIIYLTELDNQPFQFLGGILQGNNYGLGQFGRAQFLSSMRFAGLSALSEATLSAQTSNGVAYARLDYETPWVGTGMHVRTYASQVVSQANATRGDSAEFGLGLTKLLFSNRTDRWLASLDTSRRETISIISSTTENSNRVDEAVKFKLRTESNNNWFNSFNNELILTSGRMNLDKNLTDLQADSANIHGGYQKFELIGGLSQTLDQSQTYTGSMRWRGQLASKNMDSYNRLSLGGVTGLRAFTSLDGVGDMAAMLLFDLTRQLTPDLYGGLLFDVGAVKPLKSNYSATINNDAYLLKDAGVQLGGKISKLNWTLTLAKSFGSQPHDWQNQTPIGTWRSNFAVTYSF